jgi:hypothetical protein
VCYQPEEIKIYLAERTVMNMLTIFVNHGEVVEVLEETTEPKPKRLREGVDYTVEYIPEEK